MSEPPRPLREHFAALEVASRIAPACDAHVGLRLNMHRADPPYCYRAEREVALEPVVDDLGEGGARGGLRCPECGWRADTEPPAGGG